MTTRHQWLLLACAGIALSAPHSARSHEFTMDAAMNAFVRVEPGQAHLVVRVPLFVLGKIRFPTRGREIDLPSAGPTVQRALASLSEDLVLFEEGRQLSPAPSAVARLSLPSDRSFDRYDDAVAHVAAPNPPGEAVFYDQGFIDAHFVYPISSTASHFAIRTTVAPELKDFLKLTVRYVGADGDSRAMLITRDSGIVSLNPNWSRAAAGFIGLGVEHILSGFDHLLFLFCLIIPVRKLRQVIPIVTAFTVAHSFTLIGSAYDLGPSGAWFPPFVETAIAASIVYMALENILGANIERRWLVTGLFGLVHGFGFSYGLKENLQFAGRHLLIALFSFNIGIEIGQLVVLALMLPALALLRRTKFGTRVGEIILSALVAHTGWHWMSDRADTLVRTPWPRLDAAAAFLLVRWVAGLLLAVGATRAVQRLLSRKRQLAP
jgi:hypothetical protein